MIELAPDIYYIEGENKSRFPYCACLYIKGKNQRVLIDAGMGAQNLEPVRKTGIDLLILTHCHIDHRLTRKEIPDVPVWCHRDDADYLRDSDAFFSAMGLKRSGLELSGIFDIDRNLLEMDISHELADGEQIDLGGVTLEAIHTPGHTPGHTGFFIPEHGILFSGDIDLTPFGPFYGHDFADINDFLLSIQKLQQKNSRIIVSGHAGPFKNNFTEKFREYGAVIHRRDHLVLERLTRAKSIEEFRGSHLFYKAYPDFPDLIRWFELVHIEKHLERLETLGKVRQNNGRWVKA